ncbi:MAG TPA: endonuclease [Flavipsychrobacter sp.]|nr:endonuclease [Flavipsychrobacter sp.]
MKKIFTFLLLIPIAVLAQPIGYYNTAWGLNGQQLRNALYDIIKNHNSVGYSNMWSHFSQTDAKPNGKVWDIYSDVPGATPPYQYTFGADQCGNYNSEGDCYNREHSLPQSKFNSQEPMQSDFFHIYPTDGYVNGKRADFMYGVVANPTYTSMNGSKVGSNTYAGSPSGNAFEPIDSFKGDLARTYFYIATRYKSEDNGWDNWEMANGAELKQWATNMLLAWHQNDPVSQKEKDRNNSIYNIQNNRNPFIDYPVFADCIWGTANCSSLSAPVVVGDISFDVFPSPTTDKINVRWKKTEEVVTIEVINTTGQKLFHKDLSSELSLSIPVENWAEGVYIIYAKGKRSNAVRSVFVR